MTRPVGRPTSPRGCCRRSPSAETAQAPSVHRCSPGRSDLLTPLWVAERPLAGEQLGEPHTGFSRPGPAHALESEGAQPHRRIRPLDTVVATRGTEAFGGAPNDGSLHLIAGPVSGGRGLGWCVRVRRVAGISRRDECSFAGAFDQRPALTRLEVVAVGA